MSITMIYIAYDSIEYYKYGTNINDPIIKCSTEDDLYQFNLLVPVLIIAIPSHGLNIYSLSNTNPDLKVF